MKKAKIIQKDDLREEYKRSDFSGPLLRGKYAKRLRGASNIVVLQPEVAAAFPNEEAVNKALKSLIALAQATTSLTRRAGGRGKKTAPLSPVASIGDHNTLGVGFHFVLPNLPTA